MKGFILKSFGPCVAAALVSWVAASEAQAGIVLNSWDSSGLVGLKDSWSFNHGGWEYQGVSDANLGGGTTFMRANGSENNFVYYGTPRPGNHWAPALVWNTGDQYYVMSTEFNFASSRIWSWKYNVVNNTYDNGFVDAGLPVGMTDATVWNDNGHWYFMGAQWNPGWVGSRIRWSDSYSPWPDNYWGRAVTHVKDQEGQDIDTRLTDRWAVYEAPHRAFGDHSGDGRPEIFWSNGASDACQSPVSAVRRGDLNWAGGTPWIYVFNLWGGDGDIQGQYYDCNMLTHPDLRSGGWGWLRATAYRSGKHRVVNVNGW